MLSALTTEAATEQIYPGYGMLTSRVLLKWAADCKRL
ncbi:hypothetical protein EVA_12621 [gut metagenome]|uniref:Uncharacterized protein n=1 Tax=gut metagenome TaxID=749906 RepID=J9FXI5_9ZZZZ